MPSKAVRAGGGKAPPSRNRDKRSLYAAVDLGTNNCRLLVAEKRGQYFRVVESHSQIARLGEGLAETGELSEASIARALDALKAIRAKLKRRGVGHVRCIATEACRKARNGKDFIRRVQDETGLSFKIIGGREEARLAAIGCHDLIKPSSEMIMVLDIGGGSTEISFLAPDDCDVSNLRQLVRNVPILTWQSFPIGVVTLSDKFSDLASAPDEGFHDMRAYARSVFSAWKDGAAYVKDMTKPGAHIIGTSGTVTCLAGVHLKLSAYKRHMVDGTWISKDDGHAVIDLMTRSGRAGREKLPTIGEERAGLMVPGCAILSAAWDIWPAKTMRVADRGLREGLLLSMMHDPRKTRRRRGAKRKPSQETAAPTQQSSAS